MNLPHQVLDDICDTLEAIYYRLERRGERMTGTDQYINHRMYITLKSILLSLSDYRKFHTQNQVYEGLINVTTRDEFLDQWQKAYEAVTQLHILTENTLRRTGTAPGSLKRLSPLFQRIVASEKQDLQDIRTALFKVWCADTEQIKRLPRHTEMLAHG